jgi:antitoxin (DNA-binding transcriptional repressor) of toxin-antitoxin stability system
MKTLTVTEARANLSAVLERAKQGEELGIIHGNQIIQLKPTPVVPWEDSYVYQEYGVTPEEWEKFRGRMTARRTKNKYVKFKGKFDSKRLL